MVNREQLRRRGIRSYEVGRLKTALRVGWLLAPVALFCALQTGARGTCACSGMLLLGSAVFLRWRDRQGVNVVRYGLIAGSLPLIVGLVAARFGPICVGAPLVSVCSTICLGVGVPSGIWLGLQLVRSAASIWVWLSAIGIAALAASLGCIGLGIGGVAATVAGLLLGTTPVFASAGMARHPGSLG